MNERVQFAINQVNGIISYWPDKDKEKLPETLKKYFTTHATIPPSEAIEPDKKLEEQYISDETLIFLSYICKLLKQE